MVMWYFPFAAALEDNHPACAWPAMTIEQIAPLGNA